jgi:uncharacterized protein YllA (UPF0747 family)
MAKSLLVDESLFAPYLGKPVVITIRSLDDQVSHKLGPIIFNSIENQKSTGMVNAPDKRVKDGKSYTPPMIALKFEDNNNLVFVAEDMQVLIRYQGLTFAFDNYYVDMVQYSI